MYRPSSRKAVSPTNSEGPSEAWIFGSLCDQGVQIDPEGDHERPEHNRRQAFQNVAGNVPCHEIAVGSGDHYPDGQIHNPDQTYSAPAHFAPAISAYHRSSATAGYVSNHSSAGVICRRRPVAALGWRAAGRERDRGLHLKSAADVTRPTLPRGPWG